MINIENKFYQQINTKDEPPTVQNVFYLTEIGNLGFRNNVWVRYPGGSAAYPEFWFRELPLEELMTLYTTWLRENCDLLKTLIHEPFVIGSKEKSDSELVKLFLTEKGIIKK
jgi:hypothetical protein